MVKENAKVQDLKQAGTPLKIEWDDSQMGSTYANVVNAASTREEIALFFGTNTAWKGSESSVRVKLSDRIVLSPFAAKRLVLLLTAVMKQYEDRYGSLDSGSQVPQATSSEE